MLRLMMLAGLIAVGSLSGGLARADCDQVENDPAQLRACGETWSDYAEHRQAEVERQYRTSDQDTDADRDGGGRRHR